MVYPDYVFISVYWKGGDYQMDYNIPDRILNRPGKRHDCVKIHIHADRRLCTDITFLKI